MADLQRDPLEAHWMPYTGNRQFKKDPRILVAADGCFYTDRDGRQVLDSLSGLWCTGAGHNRPEITEAVAEQMATLDYSPGFQFGHPLSFQLADRVTRMTPEDLDYCFFTNSGSEAADTALKIARAYWRIQGQPAKTKLIGRVRGYHGVNFGGVSVGGIPANKKLYGPALDTDHLRHTLLPENAFSRGQPASGAALADELEEILTLHDPSNVAAVMLEPFAGSAGVIVPPAGYLKRIREICTRHQVLLILDEVITGFGRTGQLFASNTFGVVPDILTCAKQLTNGAVPLGAVIVKAAIYQAFMDTDGPEYLPELPHGYTYSAHPVACAAALAALDVLEEDQLVARVAELAPYFEDAVHSLKGRTHVVDIRNCGLAAAVQLEPYEAEPARRPFEVSMACWQQGLYLRYGGDTVQIAPPFVCERQHIDQIVETLDGVLA